MYYPDMMPPPSYPDNPINCVTTKFVKTATNKMRCPIFCMAWTPEGRRLVTGASSGEFTLWNGLTFNFETILQVSSTYSYITNFTFRNDIKLLEIRPMTVQYERWYGLITIAGWLRAIMLDTLNTGNPI